MKHEHDLNRARVEMLQRHQPGSLTLNAVAAIVLAGLAMIDHDRPSTLPWLGAGLTVIAIRAWMLHTLERCKHHPARLITWERIYAVGTLLQGLFWASAYLLLLPAQPLFIIMLHMFGATYAFIATASLSLSLICFAPAVLPVILAQMWHLWQLPGNEPFLPVILAAFYVAIIAVGVVTFRRTVLGGLRDNVERGAVLAEQQALFNNSLVGFALTRNRVFVRVNDAFAALYGFTRAEMEGQESHIIYPDRESWRKGVESTEGSLIATGQVVYEREVLRRDGEKRWLSAQANLIESIKPGAGAIWVVADVTERKKTEMRLAAREQAYRDLAETYHTLMETTPAMIWTTDASGRYTFASERGTRAIFGVSAADVQGKLFSEFMRPDDIERDVTAFRRVLAGETVLDHASPGALPDGRRITVSVSGAPLHDADGNIIGASGTNVDITERQQRAAELEHARDLLRNAIESISDGFAVFDAQDRIVLCNQRFCALLAPGLTAASMTGTPIEDIVRRRMARGEPVPPEFVGDTEDWVRERIRRHRAADGRPYLYERADGSWIQTTKRRTPDGGLVAIYSDITEFKRTEDAVRLLAQHDALTGLPNRRLLHDRLALALERARRASDLTAVLLIDLDGFKPVNDEHGHRAGDEVLRITAVRLKECVRAVDTVARYGGDEFIVVLDGLIGAEGAQNVATKIIEAVARPVSAVWASSHGRAPAELRIGCSIGISVFPADGNDPDALIRHADNAMYRAKQGGRGRFGFYSKPG